MSSGRATQDSGRWSCCQFETRDYSIDGIGCTTFTDCLLLFCSGYHSKFGSHRHATNTGHEPRPMSGMCQSVECRYRTNFPTLLHFLGCYRTYHQDGHAEDAPRRFRPRSSPTGWPKKACTRGAILLELSFGTNSDREHSC